MILAVTSRALPVTGSVSTVVQLESPLSLISRSPSQAVKLRNTHAEQRDNANTRKKTQGWHGQPAPERARVADPPADGTGALWHVVTSRSWRSSWRRTAPG